MEAKIFISFPKPHYDRKMSMVRRKVVEELELNHDVVLSGPGWDNYDTDRTLLNNIERIFPEANAVFWYKPDGEAKRGVRPLIAPAERGGRIAVESYNEAWWPNWRAAKEVNSTATDLVICHHKNDINRFENFFGYERRPMVRHIPHCADHLLFQEYNKLWHEREIPVLVAGCLSPEFYPLRCRVAELIKRGKVPGKVLPHPGYRMKSWRETLQQERRYASILGNTKISVCCSSIYGYGLAKYAESAMAGCAIAGDTNPDYSDTILSDGLLKLSTDMDDAEIIDRLEASMEIDRETFLAAQHANYMATLHHTAEVYCNRLVSNIKDCLRDHDRTDLVA